MKSVLLLNDTSNELHVGSAAISTALVELARNKLCNVYTSTFSNGRYQTPEREYDFVIVNAEGTLSRRTDRSTALIAEINRIDAPMALVSADLCNENSALLREKTFQIVHYRRHHTDSQRVSTKSEYLLPDLFYHVVKIAALKNSRYPQAQNSYFILGDSHYLPDFKEIQRHVGISDRTIRPQSMLVEAIDQTGYNVNTRQRIKNSLWWASRNETAAWRKRYRSKSLASWINSLQGSQGLYTGRFHQAVAALALNVPVRFVESKTTKLQSLNQLFPDHDIAPISGPHTQSDFQCGGKNGTTTEWNYDLFLSHLMEHLAT